MIQRFYEPAFLDLFLSYDPSSASCIAVLWVLGGRLLIISPVVAQWIAALFTIVRLRQAVRWATGLPVESRWYW
jgi:hypothetical protein